MAYSARRYPKARSKNVPAKEPRAVRNWSNYQQAVFQDIVHGEGNTQVDSYAGTGKSTTIVEGFYHVPLSRQPSLMCAFAKDIKTELERKAPDGVKVATIHSLGYQAARQAFPKIKIDDRNEKLYGFIRAERGDDPETFDVRESLSKCVSLAKGYLIDQYQEIDELIDRHDIDTCNESREGFITSVIKVLKGCQQDIHRMDFDDMIWFPNVHRLPLEKYGMVFIDEAQDLNKAQIEIALRSAGTNGRIISVGDERQAIYHFRGADSNAIQNIVNRLNSKRLTLSVTYRCAKSIVALAQQYVPGLEASPSAEEGLVAELPDSEIDERVRPGDFILSRTNAPLIRRCLNLLKANIPANIQGKDLSKNMNSLIRRSQATSVSNFLGWLEGYESVELERLTKAKRKTDIFSDKTDCLRTLCEGTESLDDVKSNIKKLFNDGDDRTDRVILSTTHKAKGLERDRVFMLSDTYRPGVNVEEDNLIYVAYTRAKRELYLVKSK